MRALPRSVKLLSQVIPVASIAHLSHENEECHGLYSPDGPSISVNRADGSERKRATLVHESLHAMFNASQLGAQAADDEEELVARLAPILLSWMRENRPMVEYLLETGP